jgi:rubredoxin
MTSFVSRQFSSTNDGFLIHHSHQHQGLSVSKQATALTPLFVPNVASLSFRSNAESPPRPRSLPTNHYQPLPTAMMLFQKSILTYLCCLTAVASAFTIPTRSGRPPMIQATSAPRRFFMATEDSETASTTQAEPLDPMEQVMDEASLIALAKSKRADDLRAQEVFMTKSTGKHACTNCDWEYDQAKGDVMMIGGQVQPDTLFADLPSNWRCPVCRASKDSFQEVVEEIPGFEVNQGYGFGTNSWTAEQKNLTIFGGLGLFFVLFLSGYAMN